LPLPAAESQRTLIRTGIPLAPEKGAPGPDRPESRRPGRRWTALVAACPSRSTLLSVSKSSGTPLA